MSESKPERDTYSIQIRLQRTVTEDAYVGVPVTSDVIVEADDGTGRIDPERLLEAAKQLSVDARVQWVQESCNTDAHPIQQPEPDDRETFDPMLS